MVEVVVTAAAFLIVVVVVAVVVEVAATAAAVAEEEYNIIAFKGAIRDFFSLLAAPRTVSNTFAQVAKAQSSENHVQQHRASITCNVLCATWYEGTAQLISMRELKSHLCERYFTG